MSYACRSHFIVVPMSTRNKNFVQAQLIIITLLSHYYSQWCHQVVRACGNMHHLQKKSLIVGINATLNDKIGEVYEKSKTGLLSAEFFL